MIHEGKEYTSEGWFSGLPGDESKYTLLFDNDYNCYITPMELEEAEYVWKESQTQLDILHIVLGHLLKQPDG